jgi:hypothetical protein
MRKSLIAALVTALTATAVLGATAASGDSHSTKAAKSKRGPRGPRGPRGFKGAPGSAGLSHIVRVDGPATSQGAFGSGSEVQSSVATCPAGTYTTGGGFESGTLDNIVAYQKSSPTQYAVISVNEFGSPNSIKAHAVCAGGNAVSAAAVRSKMPSARVTRLAEQLQARLDATRK